jgi:hypothetical protein
MERKSSPAELEAGKEAFRRAADDEDWRACSIYFRANILNFLRIRGRLGTPRNLQDTLGSPGWNRTNDQRINSPTLYR